MDEILSLLKPTKTKMLVFAFFVALFIIILINIPYLVITSTGLYSKGGSIVECPGAAICTTQVCYECIVFYVAFFIGTYFLSCIIGNKLNPPNFKSGVDMIK